MNGSALSNWIKRFRLETLRPLRIRLAARARARAEGKFIGVTGSSGKSTTTALIAAIMSTKGRVTSQIMENTINPLIRTMRSSRLVDYVVVEAGVGGRGQMKTMASLLQPDVAVVTLVGLEHYSAFRSADAIAAEKGYLVEAVSPAGLVVLNADDPLVMAMSNRSSARVVTFGFSKTADCRILDVTGGLPNGVHVRLLWKGKVLDIQTAFIGRHFAETVAAAATVGLELGVKPEDVCKAIAAIRPLPLRLSVHKVDGGPLILADSAKAPLGTLQLAFDALRAADAPRRRIVLGAISDYKGERKRVYRRALESAFAFADEVILISDVDRPERFAPAHASEGRFRCFDDMLAASNYIAQSAIPDEVILLKGSANFHLERILIDMMEQVRCWKLSCGRQESCYKCGMYGFEHQTHRSVRRRRRWSKFFSMSRSEKNRTPTS